MQKDHDFCLLFGRGHRPFMTRLKPVNRLTGLRWNDAEKHVAFGDNRTDRSFEIAIAVSRFQSVSGDK